MKKLLHPKQKRNSNFIDDRRKDNPGLHLLYVKSAVVHLREIDKTIKRFHNFCNLNMTDVILSLFKNRKKLCKENAAYAEADEILNSLFSKKV